jgi:GNAT superfamily N-acetyltransferase
MPGIEFRSAASLSSDAMAALFTRGYEGYLTPVQVGATEFDNMVLTSDLDLDASCVGFENGIAVTFALLGVRGPRGWVGGMGVVPEARGQGHGRSAMERLIAAARQRGITALDLEVLENNLHAARIYEALGFRDRRWLDVWVRDPGALAPAGHAPPRDATSGPNELPVEECLARHQAFHTARLPWQRELASLRHWAPRLSALGVRGARGLSGWVLYRSPGERLNIADLAAAPGEPIERVANALAGLIAARPSCTTMLVNLPEDDAFSGTMRGLGAEVRLRQREMTLALD